MAASEANRPLIYTAFLDEHLAASFAEVYEYLKNQKATVSDLYRYLELYCDRRIEKPLFEYILST